jgi:hypothetical protein
VYAVARLDFTSPITNTVIAAAFAASVQSKLQSYVTSSGNHLTINMSTLKIHGELAVL